jgi:hypothetical protein
VSVFVLFYKICLHACNVLPNRMFRLSPWLELYHMTYRWGRLTAFLNSWSVSSSQVKWIISDQEFRNVASLIHLYAMWKLEKQEMWFVTEFQAVLWLFQLHIFDIRMLINWLPKRLFLRLANVNHYASQQHMTMSHTVQARLLLDVEVKLNN